MLDYGCPAYLSANANVKELTRICDMLEKYDIYFIEEPLNPHNIENFALLTSISPIKIATGESLTTLIDLKRFIDKRALDIIQPDVQQIGITWFLEVMKLCESTGILCIPHCPWTSIAVAAHLNILCTSANQTMIEYPAFASFEKDSDTSKQTSVMHNSITDYQLQVQDGYLSIPERNGLGLGNYLNNVPKSKALPRNNSFESR
jgi:L-alanine-DL-glutamate epimerase-like enolase superfamily enzyme